VTHPLKIALEHASRGLSAIAELLVILEANSVACKWYSLGAYQSLHLSHRCMHVKLITPMFTWHICGM